MLPISGCGSNACTAPDTGSPCSTLTTCRARSPAATCWAGIRVGGLAGAQNRARGQVGVVKNFSDLPARPDDGTAYCRALRGSTIRLKCYEAVGEEIATLHGDARGREAACAEVAPAYRGACRYGARLTARREG